MMVPADVMQKRLKELGRATLTVIVNVLNVASPRVRKKTPPMSCWSVGVKDDVITNSDFCVPTISVM